MKCPECESKDITLRLDAKHPNGGYVIWVECEECNYGADYYTNDNSLDELLD